MNVYISICTDTGNLVIPDISIGRSTSHIKDTGKKSFGAGIGHGDRSGSVGGPNRIIADTANGNFTCNDHQTIKPKIPGAGIIDTTDRIILNSAFRDPADIYPGESKNRRENS